MKKRGICQTSIDTHPVPMAEANGKRVEIIATLYTASACAYAAIFADSSKVKGLTLGRRGSDHRPDWSTVAFLRSSEEDVYYRNDSML
jgi:hypothetical protein